MPHTIIVTGASRGIGLATAQALLAGGAQVTAVQRTISAELAELREKHARAFRVVLGDCTDGTVINRVIQETLDAFGAIDGLVFNAGTVGPIGTIAELPLDAWQNTFDTNVFSIVKFLRQALPVVADDARIIFLSSVAWGEVTFSAGGPYSASKAVINSLNRTLAVEQPGKVCVAIHPGGVATVMHRDFARDAKPYNPELLGGPDIVIEAELPARVIAKLALRAPPELSGKYLHWDDPVLTGI
ncbi:short-chain dehydrogenase [Auricularia subglabra TFB-10046 SS5]|nr:short-chain dehydrogenase [Auricularia subglabra TFB-10046 SS5]